MKKNNINRKLKRDQKIIKMLIWLVAFLCLLFFIGVSWIVWQITLGIIGSDWTHGTKGVIESFWYGKDIKP